MPNQEFSFLRTPRILFGAGSLLKLGRAAAGFGRRALVLRSRSFAERQEQWNTIRQSLDDGSIEFVSVDVHGEPSPDLVDGIVSSHAGSMIDTVIAIGGGSVIDAGKAVSAMLPVGEPVVHYLEEVGDRAHPGNKFPFIAVPTTAGTGSEASANAVLSRTGANGFKKSLRHENLVPDIALIDPGLALSCPSTVTAACGMDAFTQLLEAYVSPAGSAMTDALVESALPQVRNCLVAAATSSADDLAVRAGMAYAALVSGIALASAGLGVVHGLASPIGGLFHVPHGVVCGILVGPAVQATVAALKKSANGRHALTKYSRAGSMVSGAKTCSIEEGCTALMKTISLWAEQLRLPRLSQFGLIKSDIKKITAGTANKNNPIPLSSEEIAGIVAGGL